jgi:hypothetical protein
LTHAEDAAQLFDFTRTNSDGQPAVQVELKASVLDVSGFPITVQVGDNVSAVARRNIQAVPSAHKDSSAETSPENVDGGEGQGISVDALSADAE